MKLKFSKTNRDIDWSVLLFIGIYHILLFALLPIYLIKLGAPSLSIILSSFVLYAASGLAITVGYHRFYSHKTFKLNPVAEFLVISAGNLTAAGTVLDWVHDHRRHHKFVDTDRDPYNIKKGFWWADFIWLFHRRWNWDQNIIKDLAKNKLVMFQHRFYGGLMVGTNIAVILLVGWLSGDYLGAFVFAFLLRMFFGHHCMFFINSLAHFSGSKPYSTEHTAVNNWFISFLTFGEGYHNFHHTFSYDYRNGVRWYQFDPSKTIIWCLEKFGLASDLKRAKKYRILLSLIREDEKLLLKSILRMKNLTLEKRLRLVEEARSMSSGLYEQIKELNRCLKEYWGLEKAELESQVRIDEFEELITKLRRQFKAEFNEWGQFCNSYAT